VKGRTFHWQVPAGQRPVLSGRESLVRSVSIIALALACAAHLSTASAQAPARFPGQAQALPGQTPYSTTKVPGTESVYIFHYGNYQSMFIIASDGVIVTDPQNPEAAGLYLAEIRKITDAPIRYVIYSHDHPDHISGGKPFKDAGASFVAHRNTKDALIKLNNPNIVPVDIAVDLEHALTVGGTHVELLYVGKNVSDSSLVVRLPNERLIYVVTLFRFTPCRTAR
jgi:glyoxylase-like metal-dependent hydrolase (beta-lactamase superfamily II)